MSKLDEARKAYLTLWWRRTYGSGENRKTTAIEDASWEYVAALEARNAELEAVLTPFVTYWREMLRIVPDAQLPSEWAVWGDRVSTIHVTRGDFEAALLALAQQDAAKPEGTA